MRMPEGTGIRYGPLGASPERLASRENGRCERASTAAIAPPCLVALYLRERHVVDMPSWYRCAEFHVITPRLHRLVPDGAFYLRALAMGRGAAGISGSVAIRASHHLLTSVSSQPTAR